MSNSNLPQNFNKGNSLPQSPALVVRQVGKERMCKMKMKLNFVRDEREKNQAYEVTKATESSVSGFWNAFNAIIELDDQQAAMLQNMFEVESPVYAYPDKRYKSGYRFEQY